MILLCDMNSFFASVHQSHDARLRGKPVIIAGNPQKRKGIVVAASYEAKAKGVYTTMRYFEAKQKCPEAIFIQPDHTLYRQYSQTIMRFLARIAPCEVSSIDEAYLDISTMIKKGHTAREVAHYIQRKLDTELQIPCSIGAGPNRVIAKMCADVKKPNGYVSMGRKQFQSYFWPQDVSLLHGCGQKTVQKLHKKGIYTIGELAKTPLEPLTKSFGKKGMYLHEVANGTHDAPINPDKKKGEKSIGMSRTFPNDISDIHSITNYLDQFSEQMAKKLEQKQKKAKTISIEIKYRYDQTLSRSYTMDEATDDAQEIKKTTRYLYQEHFEGEKLRLLGIRLHNLEDKKYEQLKFPF